MFFCFFIVSGLSSSLTFLFSEIYYDLELHSLVPFTPRDLFISWKCEVAVSLSLRHWSTHLDSLLVRQEQLEGPSVARLRAVGLK